MRTTYMKNRPKVPLPAKLAQGRQCFEQWRNQQTRRTRLPKHLWSLATELAREFGLSRTACTLRLSYNCLKKQMKMPASDLTSQTKYQTQFVELRSTQADPVTECAIECENIQGAKMRIQLKGQDLEDLTRLCRELWRPHS
jgi:hypothetical protein